MEIDEKRLQPSECSLLAAAVGVLACPVALFLHLFACCGFQELLPFPVAEVFFLYMQKAKEVMTCREGAGIPGSCS